MKYSIIDIEGIGPQYKEKLNAVNIQTTQDLLERAKTPSLRKQLAEASGIDGSLILSFANLADMMRINGVSSQYSELLHEAGVDTVKELATRNAENLAAAMMEANEKSNATNKVPGAESVTNWIEQAKEMEHILEY